MARRPPRTRYVRSPDGVHIAYQTVGDGERDVVLLDGWVSPLEGRWDQPVVARNLERLASFSRLISFDKRGIGLSDRVALDASSTLEAWAEDVITVMDTAGSERAAVMGANDGGMAAMLFAATHPEKVSALILVNTSAKAFRDEKTPWAVPQEVYQRILGDLATWYGVDGARTAASTGKVAGGGTDFQKWWTRARRHQASPAAFQAFIDIQSGVDLRPVLEVIQAPTLVIWGADDDFLPPGHGEYLAANIPWAKSVAIPGLPNQWHAQNGAAVVDEVEAFLTGSRPPVEPDRVLATVVFTDIADSTGRAAELGDRDWKDLLERFREAVRSELQRHRGKEINHRGDDILATFDGPARAVHYACAVREAVAKIGIEVRSGLHTGEVQLMDDDIGGIGVHIGARISELAPRGEILVSRTVVDLVAGSGLAFDDLGEHELKGIPAAWRIFAVRG